ncbi:MAG: large conductance mechanosensitive channel protein MscL [Oscillospiraceae bacterium]|nr:large conductance mechanosensitive channel protein MscL [Oscillospiraceae bacterium]
MSKKGKEKDNAAQAPEQQENKMTKVGAFFHEFRTFAVKGNMMDMAIGMIVGGAFTLLVTSIVTHIATPLLGILIGVDFSGWTITLPHLYGNAEPGVLAIGSFLNATISFFIVAFVVFLFVKAINAFHHKSAEEAEPPPPPEPSAEELLLTEIRDLLKAQSEK